MEKRKIYSNGFTLINHHRYILAGSQTINGDVLITNANLIVYGNLTIRGDLVITNGNLIVTGSLEILKSKQISVYGNISAGRLKIVSLNVFTIHVWGNISVDLSSYIDNALECNNFNVQGNSYSHSINCLNFLIGGDNDSHAIQADEDIYILGSNDSVDLIGRNVLVNNEADFNDGVLNALMSAYVGGPISNCSSFNVGN